MLIQGLKKSNIQYEENTHLLCMIYTRDMRDVENNGTLKDVYSRKEIKRNYRDIFGEHKIIINQHTFLFSFSFFSFQIKSSVTGQRCSVYRIGRNIIKRAKEGDVNTHLLKLLI